MVAEKQVSWAVFSTDLGWMAFCMAGRVVRQVSFGHSTRESATRSCGTKPMPPARWSTWQKELSERLQRYAEGVAIDFCDIPVDPGPCTIFQSRVLQACREIGYGKTRSYGELASEVGVPGAARAVGNCMAGNRVPLIIPCHRVVCAGGAVGPFSAPGGTNMKKRLLEMEHQALLSAGFLAKSRSLG